MQTYPMDPHDLASWVEDRLVMIVEDGGSAHMIRGYADYAAGREPDHEGAVGDPFAADHYYEGYGLAVYELGNATSMDGVAA